MAPEPRHHSCNISLTASGFTVAGTGPGARAFAGIDTVLRGSGQVLLQDNAWAGALFLGGVFYNSALFGSGVVVGVVASSLTAALLGVDRAQVRAGLYGFNGALVAIALLYYLQPVALTWGYVVVAAACTSIAMAALTRGLAAWQLPALTAPFVITTLVFILASARFGRLQVTDVLPTAGLPTAATVHGVVTGTTIVEGVCNGLAEVFFQHNVLTGVLIAAGLLVGSWRAFAAAVLGSLLGALVAWGMGADAGAIGAGAFGFNCVLTAVALGAGRFALNAASACWAVLAIAVTAVVFAAVSAALQPLGMPALTAPFVLVTWLFLLAGPVLRHLRPVVAAA